jgi:hypothetical protein
VKVQWFLIFFVSAQLIFKWLDRVATDGRSVALLRRKWVRFLAKRARNVTLSRRSKLAEQ